MAGEHWSVKVERDGTPVVTIEPRMLSGRDLIDGDEAVIIEAAMALIGFIAAIGVCPHCNEEIAHYIKERPRNSTGEMIP